MQRRVLITSQGYQTTTFHMRSMVDIQMTGIVEMREEKIRTEAETEGKTLMTRDIPMKRNITMQAEEILETRICLT